jgi:hypothetical protein
VGSGAFAVTPRAAACFVAAAATGGVPTIVGAAGWDESSLELASATGVALDSVACVEPGSLDELDGGDELLPPLVGTVSCGGVPCGVVSVGVESVGVVSVGVVSVGVVSVGVVSPLQ